MRKLSQQDSIHGLGNQKPPSAVQQRRDGDQVESVIRQSPKGRGHGTTRIPDTADPASDTRIEYIQQRHLELNTNLTASTSAKNKNELMPEAIGTETCPICILDFEEGDDVRILPCEGQHKFHQTCVDPWLLELSSSCPICRHGEDIICVSYRVLMLVRLLRFGNDVI